jgi:hypothetical protein
LSNITGMPYILAVFHEEHQQRPGNNPAG